MTAFACAQCGAQVVVEARRNHRYCAACSGARGATKKAEWQAVNRDVRARVRGAEDWAEVEVARILGLEIGPRSTCRGCGVSISPKRGGRGMPRKWCSNSCRVRVAGRGAVGAVGYAGALLRDPCAYCADTAEELDHIVPASTGGSGEWDNLAPVCRRCNGQKKDRDVLRHLLARPLYRELERVRGELALLSVAA